VRSPEGFQDVLLGGEDLVSVFDGVKSGFYVERIFDDPDYLPWVFSPIFLEELPPTLSFLSSDEFLEGLLVCFPVLGGSNLAVALEHDVDLLVPPFLASGHGALL